MRIRAEIKLWDRSSASNAESFSFPTEHVALKTQRSYVSFRVREGLGYSVFMEESDDLSEMGQPDKVSTVFLNEEPVEHAISVLKESSLSSQLLGSQASSAVLCLLLLKLGGVSRDLSPLSYKNSNGNYKNEAIRCLFSEDFPKNEAQYVAFLTELGDSFFPKSVFLIAQGVEYNQGKLDRCPSYLGSIVVGGAVGGLSSMYRLGLISSSELAVLLPLSLFLLQKINSRFIPSNFSMRSNALLLLSAATTYFSFFKFSTLYCLQKKIEIGHSDSGSDSRNAVFESSSISSNN